MAESSEKNSAAAEENASRRMVRLAEELAAGPAFDPNLFTLWQKHGFHITPNHFYQPIPDTAKLDDSLFDRDFDMPGVDMNDSGQIEFLQKVCMPYRDEYDQFPPQATDNPFQFHFGQPMFRMVDAEALHCVVRHFKPKRIIEIGSGHSTLITSAAGVRNAAEGHPVRLTCIEPFPGPLLLQGVPGLENLIQLPVESVDPAVFAELGANDILFIDSSHVLRIQNDVYREFIEILPRLAPGVLVHVHDIFLPREYPKTWIKDSHFFWTEQYLLQAFLAFNSAFHVLFGACYMHLKHGEHLKRAFRSYDSASVLPGSFWMRRTS